MKNSPSQDDSQSKSLGEMALDFLNSDEPAPPVKAESPSEPTKSPETPTDAPPVVAKLEAAIAELQMPSETDEPIRAVYWPLEKAELTDSEVAFYAAERADAPVETRGIEEFFGNAATVEDWMSDDEKADAKRFGELIQTLQTELENPRVYLIGERERTAAAIGKVEGGFAGVTTLVVET